LPVTFRCDCPFNALASINGLIEVGFEELLGACDLVSMFSSTPNIFEVLNAKLTFANQIQNQIIIEATCFGMNTIKSKDGRDKSI
jgi:hypothetical protein